MIVVRLAKNMHYNYYNDWSKEFVDLLVWIAYINKNKTFYSRPQQCLYIPKIKKQMFLIPSTPDIFRGKHSVKLHFMAFKS